MKVTITNLYVAALSIVACNAVTYSDLKQLDEKYSKCKEIDIRETTIIQAQERFFDNKWTSEDITGCYMERIKAMDPVLHSVIEVNPSASSQARALDKHLKDTGKLKGPLHGIPILLKDGIATFDNLNTTAGSFVLLNTKPKADATLVKKLREAGAIILGKANMAEFNGVLQSAEKIGWSARGGQPLNPYGEKLNVFGSSSGSAISVSANLCLASIGVDTSGSIINPASAAMTVGFKVSYGGVSNNGVVPLIKSQEVPGPITRTVEDSLIISDALAESTLKESLNSVYQGSLTKPISPFKKVDVKGMRIGILKNLYTNTTPEAELRAHNHIKEELTNKFKVTVIPDLEMDLTFSDSDYLTILVSSLKNGMNEYLKNDVTAVGSENITSLADIVSYNEKNKERVIKEGQEILEYAEQSGTDVTSDEFKKTLENFKNTNRASIDKLIKAHNLDALVAPSFRANFDDPQIMPFSSGAGYPLITVPVGMHANGEPFGMVLAGTLASEGKLLRLALAVEKATEHPRVKPDFE